MNAGGHSQPHAATIPHGVFKHMKFSCRGHLGHEEVRCQRRHFFIACDISSGRRADVPAKTTPVWQIRKTAPVREIRRPAMP